MTLIPAAVALIACAAAASAGGAVTHAGATFTTRADTACANAGAQITRLPKLTDANLLQTVKQETAIVSKLVTRLDAITPPASKAARYRAFIRSTRDESRYLRAGIRAYQSGQVTHGNSLIDKAEVAGKRGDKLAAKLKLPACAKDYSAQG